MNPARLRSIEDGLTNIAKKVLDAVPIAEAWTVHKIGGELARVGVNIEHKTISGCLTNLVDSGLVRELMKGHFQRIKPKPPTDAVPQPERVPAGIASAKPPPPLLEKRVEPKKTDFLSAVGTISNKLRAMADEIDDLALAMQSEAAANAAEAERLAQLKKLLRELA